MNNKLCEISETLNKSVLTDDFIDICYELADELNDLPNPLEVVEIILRLIEDNPDTDFGTPGPLVHFAEKFHKRGYEENLLSPLKDIQQNILYGC